MKTNNNAVIDNIILWKVFSFIRTQWGTIDNVNQNQFELILNYRISLNPSYTNYYEETIAEFNVLLQQYGNEQMALNALYKDNQSPNPKNLCINKYVLQEFMNMNVAFGGFKAIGYENYRGWMGGGNFNQTPPPYRVAACIQGEKS